MYLLDTNIISELKRIRARLMHRRSDDLLVDALIAATALVHHLVVVTRNVRDFTSLEIETLNPFETISKPDD